MIRDVCLVLVAQYNDQSFANSVINVYVPVVIAWLY